MGVHDLPVRGISTVIHGNFHAATLKILLARSATGAHESPRGLYQAETVHS